MTPSHSKPNDRRREQLIAAGIIFPATRPRRLPAERENLSPGPSIAELIEAERR